MATPAKKQSKGVPPIPAAKAVTRPVKVVKAKKLTKAERSVANKAEYAKLLAEERAKEPRATPHAVVQGSKPRPTKYDAELGKKICMMFATDPSMSLIKLNRNPELPTLWTWYEWLRDNPVLDKMYTLAQDLHVDLGADELEEMAATPMIGEVRTRRTGKGFKGEDIDTEEVRTFDNVERTKVRVGVRQWRLAKLRPRKYGAQPIDLENNDALQELLGQFRSRSREIENA